MRYSATPPCGKFSAFRVVSARRTTELKQLRFEFAHVAAHSDQLLDVLHALRFQLFEEEVLCAVRDFQVAVLEFEFLHAVAAFRILPGRCFRTLRHLRFSDRCGTRRCLLCPLLFDCP